MRTPRARLEHVLPPHEEVAVATTMSVQEVRGIHAHCWVSWRAASQVLEATCSAAQGRGEYELARKQVRLRGLW